MNKSVCRISVVVLMLSMTLSHATAHDPFPIDLALARKQFSMYEPTTVSPDGKFAAYAIVTPTSIRGAAIEVNAGPPEIALGHRLYVADLTTGESVKVSQDESNAWAASWSPDGKSLAFLSDADSSVGLWLYQFGGSAKRLGSAVLNGRAHMRPQWSPDGKAVFVALAEPNEKYDENDTLEQGATSAIIVRTSGAEKPKEADSEALVGYETIDQPSAIGVVNAASGVATVLIPSDHETQPAAACLSPSGKFLLIESALRSIVGTSDDGMVSNLALVRLADRTVIWEEKGFRLEDAHDPVDLTDSSRVAANWHPTNDSLFFVKGGSVYRLDTEDKPTARKIDLGGDYTVCRSVVFSRDSNAILVAVRAPDSKSTDPEIERVLLVPLDGGAVKTLATPSDFKLRRVVKANSRTAWQPTKTDFILLGTKSGEPVYVRVSMDNLTVSEIPMNGLLTVHAASADDPNIALGVFQDVQTAPDLYVIDAELKPGTRLSRIEPKLDRFKLGQVKFFETEVKVDGEQKTVRSAIVLPPGAKQGDKLPTIVTLYPGANYSYAGLEYGGGEISSLPTLLFTTRGYAVLLVDVPLSPEGQPSNPLAEIIEVVVPQVKRSAELGYTDLNRVAVTGQSYGGYGTACLVSATDLFAAAVPVAGVFDLAGSYACFSGNNNEDETFNIVWSEQHQGRMGKPLWDDPRRYIDNSPYFQADRIHTPLLIIHGQADETCSVEESEKLFNSLRRLERTAQLAVYEGEGHVPAEWSRENVVDLLERILAFLDRHLKERVR